MNTEDLKIQLLDLIAEIEDNAVGDWTYAVVQLLTEAVEVLEDA